MRRFLLALAIVVSIAPPAEAAARGVIDGIVTNGTKGGPQGGVRVSLLGSTRDGSKTVERTATTSPNGSYRFEGLPSSDDWVYVLDARFDGGLFPGSPFDFSTGPELETSLKVWNTTDDPNAILIARDAMFVLPGENEVGIVESVKVLNHGKLAYIGRSGAGPADRVTLGFSLPKGAEAIAMRDASIDIPALIPTDYGFGIDIAIPPDSSDFSFTYRVRANGSTYILSKTALYPTAEMLVFAGEPLDVASDRLTGQGNDRVDGKDYRRLGTTDGLDAGDTVLIQATATASLAWWPFAAAAAALVAAVGGAALFARKRRPRRPSGETGGRSDLVAAIASLDIAYESGSVSEDDWRSQRRVLKSRLERESSGHSS